MSQADRKPCPTGAVHLLRFPKKDSDGRFPEKFLIPTPSVAKDLMPRDILSSEPRHWIVFGKLVMPVQYYAEARRRRVPQHSTAQAWPTGQIPSSALAQMT